MNRVSRPHRPLRFGVQTHITYRLYGSIPMVELRRMREESVQAARERFPTKPENYLMKEMEFGYFLLREHHLHQCQNGPFHLADSRVQQAVIKSWQWLARRTNLALYAVCVMPNHVHVVAEGPEGDTVVELGKVVNRTKTHTAKMANRLLDLGAGCFWEKNYFDRDVRKNQFTRVLWYVLNNPASAGLVNDWEDWSGTWLNPEFDLLYRKTGETL